MRSCARNRARPSDDGATGEGKGRDKGREKRNEERKKKGKDKKEIEKYKLENI
jgi:hypothetical protein